MNKETFDKTLKDIGLTRKEFAEIVNITYGAVSNWNDSKKPVPGWVESWLENYKAKKDFEKIKTTLKATGVCDS
jgi:predicted transcriptional regulator